MVHLGLWWALLGAVNIVVGLGLLALAAWAVLRLAR